MNSRFRLGLSLCGALLLPIALSARGEARVEQTAAGSDLRPVILPAPSEGNVDGRQGISFWPLLMIEGEERAVDPTGCIVYLVPTDVDRRLSYPCGKWFAPPPDRYSVWLEQGNHISDRTVINSGGARFSNDGAVVTMPMGEAGFAVIASDVVIDGHKTGRFVSLEPSSAGFDKRLQSSEAHSPHRLPAGRAIGGVFDADGNTIALSRPFSITSGQTTVVRPRAPGKAADLMLVLSKHLASPQDRMLRKTTIIAKAGAEVYEPEVVYEDHGRIIVIWYGITAKTLAIDVVSDVFRLERSQISLTQGSVTTVREELDLNTIGVIR